MYALCYAAKPRKDPQLKIEMQFQSTTITCSSCSQCSYNSSDDSYFTAIIPSNETDIHANAFSSCSRLIAVVIPK